jgi:hypothetical protein
MDKNGLDVQWKSTSHGPDLSAVGRDKGVSEARDKRHPPSSFVAHSLGLCVWGCPHVLCRINHLTVNIHVHTSKCRRDAVGEVCPAVDKPLRQTALPDSSSPLPHALLPANVDLCHICVFNFRQRCSDSDNARCSRLPSPVFDSDHD